MTDRRHDVRVLDCSIRDGGCCNEWQFSPDLVKRTYRALHAAGVDYMEIGYRTSPGKYDPAACGPWKGCDDDFLASFVDDTGIRVAVMLDWGRATEKDLRPRSRSPISMVRV